MAINKPDFTIPRYASNPGPSVGEILMGYSKQLADKERQEKLDARTDAEWARKQKLWKEEDVNRARNEAYGRASLEPNQVLAGGVTDAAMQKFNPDNKGRTENIYGGLELTPREMLITEGELGESATPEEKALVERKLAAQEEFGRNLMTNAPTETELMKRQRLLGEIGWTPEIGTEIKNAQAAELAAQQSKEKDLRNSRSEYLKAIDKLNIDIAKERGGGLGKSKSSGSGSGTKGITFQEMYSKLPEKADVSWSMLPRGLQLDTKEGQENIENVVKTLAKTTGKSENVIREIALNELGNAFEPGFWGNTLNLDTQEQKNLFAAKVKDNLLKGGNGKYNYGYVKELEDQKAAALAGVADADRKLAGVYADPRQARINAAADTYGGLLDRAVKGLNAPKKVEGTKDTELKKEATGFKTSKATPQSTYDEKIRAVEPDKRGYQSINKHDKPENDTLGMYQIKRGNLDEYRNKLNMKFTDDEFLASKEIQDKVYARYTKDNEDMLKKAGVPVNDWTKWTAHNLGIGNAIKYAKGEFDDPDLKKAMGANLPGAEATAENYAKKWGELFGIDKGQTAMTEAEKKAYLDKAVGNNSSTSNKIQQLRQSNTAPTEEVKQLFQQLEKDEYKQHANAIKASMKMGGIAPMSEKTKNEWRVLGKILKDSGTKSYSVLKDVYDTYQNVIGKPFSRFIQEYAPGGNRL